MLNCLKDRKTWYLLALSGQFYLAQSFNIEYKKIPKFKIKTYRYPSLETLHLYFKQNSRTFSQRVESGS